MPQKLTGSKWVARSSISVKHHSFSSKSITRSPSRINTCSSYPALSQSVSSNTPPVIQSTGRRGHGVGFYETVSSDTVESTVYHRCHWHLVKYLFSLSNEQNIFIWSNMGPKPIQWSIAGSHAYASNQQTKTFCQYLLKNTHSVKQIAAQWQLVIMLTYIY